MNKQGVLEMLVAMIICGTIGITVLMSGQSEISLIFFRCFFGAAVLLVVCLFKGYLGKNLFNIRTIAYSLAGGIALLANWYFLFSAYEHTSIGVATTVYNVQPIIMIALGILIFKEKVNGDVLRWTGVSLVGLVLISKISEDLTGLPKSWSYLLGIFEAFLAAALYAIAALFARLLKGNPPTLIAFLQMLLGIAVLWPFANLELFSDLKAGQQLVATVLLGVVHTGVMYILLYGALQKIEAYKAASISFIYPALAIFIDSIFLNVKLSGAQWIGILLILMAAAGINLKVKWNGSFKTKKQWEG